MKTQIDYFEHKTSIKVQTIKPIYGGLNSQNYLINDTYVLRMKLPIIDTYYSPMTEKMVEQTVQTFHCSPELLFFDVKHGHKITRYLTHVTHFDKSQLHHQWPLLLNHLNRMHQVQVSDISNFNGRARLLHYQQLAKIVPLVHDQETILNKISTIEKRYPMVLSHNDLVQGNMLFRNNESWLIDFEYAGMNSFLFDYFSFISENQITHPQDIKWTALLYFQHEKELSNHDFHAYHSYMDLLWYSWAKAMFQQTHLPIYDWIAGEKKVSFFEHYQPSK